MAYNFSSSFFTFIIFCLVAFSLISFSSSIPFILLHGLGDACSNYGASAYTRQLSSLSGSPGFCLEVGNGALTSWTMPLLKQVAEVCNKVKSISQLKNGYNIVAQSQGSLVGRGLVEFCDDAPPVINFISMGGPQAGVASLPPCSPFDLLCNQYSRIAKSRIYEDSVQATIAPSNYVKEPNDIATYLAKSSFLPKLNNELPHKNATYKTRLTSLKNLVLILFEEDTIVIPKESSWFGFYPDNYNGPIQLPNKTKLYTEDWIGLKTLDKRGRLKFVSVPGEHLVISFRDTLQYVVPYLRGNAPERGSSVNADNFQEETQNSKQSIGKPGDD